LFLGIGALAGLAPGYLLGSGGWAVDEVAVLVDEVRLQNRTLDYLLGEQESSFSTSLTQCRSIQANLESQLEACLFETVERERDSAADPAPRKLRGTDPFTETRDYPVLPDGENSPAANGDRE
jgi:hypothetical protein